jgi:hypothetical protein
VGIIGGLLTYEGDAFLDDADAQQRPAEQLGVEKMWHALGLVLCPDPEWSRFVEPPHPHDPMRGGQRVGGEYEASLTYYGPAEVAVVAAAVDATDDATARERFDPQAFGDLGVYWYHGTRHRTWSDDDVARDWEQHLLPRIHQVRAFYAAAASTSRYVVLWQS